MRSLNLGRADPGANHAWLQSGEHHARSEEDRARASFARPSCQYRTIYERDVEAIALHIADENGVRTGRSDDVLLREPLCSAFRALYASGGGIDGRLGHGGRMGVILGACHATTFSAWI